MKEELITFKTAKLAKESGFIHKTNHPTYNGEEWESNLIDTIPTQSFLQRWLREEHNIKLSILFRESMETGIETWDWLIKGQSVFYRRFSTYEKAFEAGLFEALKLIK